MSNEYEVHMNPYLVLDGTKTKLYGYSQITFESNTLHHNTSVTLIEVFEHNDGTLYRDKDIIEIVGKKIREYFDITTASLESCALVETITPDKILAVAFLSCSDRSH